MNKTKTFLAGLYLLLNVLNCDAQSWLWAKSGDGNGSGSGEGWSVATDVSGDIFFTGTFDSGTITFGTYTLNLTSGASYDMFLVKYDPNGNVLWAKNTGAKGIVDAYSVKTDPSGNVYVTGKWATVSSTIAFGTSTLTNNGGYDVFLAKYDPNGNPLWARNAGGANYDEGNSVSTDASGNVFLSGDFQSPTMSFGTTTLTTGSGYSVFITKYDSNGNVLWAKNSGGSGQGLLPTISTDVNGNTYMTGRFTSPNIVFSTYTLTSSGSGFLTKYDPNGNVLWAKTTGGTGGYDNSTVATDAYSNAYITGGFYGTIVLGTYTLTSSGSRNFFIAKYDASGNVVWAKNAVSTSVDNGYTISVYNGDVFVTGRISSSSMNFGSYNLISPGGTDPMFIAHYDLSGNLITADALVSGGDDMCAVTIDKFCNAYIGGDFWNTNPFIVGTTSLTLTGVENAFIAKLSFACQPDNISENPGQNQQVLPYPNPFTTVTNIKFDKILDNATIRMYNVSGQTVKEINNFSGTNYVLSREDLNDGIYFFQIVSKDMIIVSDKIVISN